MHLVRATGMACGQKVRWIIINRPQDVSRLSGRGLWLRCEPVVACFPAWPASLVRYRAPCVARTKHLLPDLLPHFLLVGKSPGNSTGEVRERPNRTHC